LQGNDVICFFIPRPTLVILLLFVVLSLRVVLAGPVSSQGKATPLHVAALHGHAEVAKVLLAAGANVHAADAVSGEEGDRLDYRGNRDMVLCPLPACLRSEGSSLTLKH
jgi:hypothetical protein